MMDINYRDDHKQVLDELLLPMPGVQGGKAFGYPAYKVNGKVFAFVGGGGIALKLPPERVAALLAEQGAYQPFEPAAGRVWKQWISIDRDRSPDYRTDLPLMEESHGFVAEQS
jgi:predicted DNA-binding protein (MmcQ/YjbR family)